MLEAIRENPKREHLCSAKRIFRARSIRHAAGQLHDLDEPAPIVFLFELVAELHASSVSHVEREDAGEELTDGSAARP